MLYTFKVPQWDENCSHFGQGEIQTNLIGMDGSRGTIQILLYIVKEKACDISEMLYYNCQTKNIAIYYTVHISFIQMFCIKRLIKILYIYNIHTHTHKTALNV